MLLMWVLYSSFVAIVTNVVQIVFLIIFIMNGFDIVSKLHLNEDEAVSGRFNDFSKYQNMNDLDSAGGLQSQQQMH